MHDFLQNQAFNSQSPFTATRGASDVLLSLTRAFNEPAGAYRPSPTKLRGVGAPRLQRRRSKSLSSQLSALS